MRATIDSAVSDPHTASVEAKRRFLRLEGRPLFFSDWLRAVFIHYEVDADVLQRAVPFEIDSWNGRGIVSIVAFTMRGLRLAIPGRIGSRLGSLLTLPAATHGLLNVRTYVRDGGEPGIFFLNEWIPNPLSALVGPRTYGLPYRLGRLMYRNDHRSGEVSGVVRPLGFGEARGTREVISYRASVDARSRLAPCEPATLDHFLLERYAAFTEHTGRRRVFRIWHEPWEQARIGLDSFARLADSALEPLGEWARTRRPLFANVSPGVRGVWIGPPRKWG